MRPSSLAESESVSSLDMRAWDGGEVMLVIGGAAGGVDRIQDPPPPKQRDTVISRCPPPTLCSCMLAGFWDGMILICLGRLMQT